LLLGTLLATASAQPTKFGQPDERAASGKADQVQGAEILADFRRAGIAGDYWLSFELRVMPRKGTERTVSGYLMGTRGESGPLSRLEVGADRWLISSGRLPSAWHLGVDGQLRELGPADTGQAIAGTDITIFDLQMPFLYWENFTYEGEARVRGRPTHSFILYPPSGTPLPQPELSGVRVLIDVQFQAMVQADILDQKGLAVRSISLLDLKKVEEQWLVKTIDVRSSRTRDKTRFGVNAAALDLHWPAETFQAGQLAEDAAVVPKAKIVRF